LELNQEKPFSIRIAKEDAILLENFKLPPNTEPQTLPLSERMKVKLVSTPSNAFLIRSIPPDADEVQSIDYDEFTQWDFSITPLKEGKHAITLYAYKMQMIHGKETEKGYPFQYQIDVVTEPVPMETYWIGTPFTIGTGTQKSWLSLLTAVLNKFTLPQLVAWGIGFTIALAGLGYWAYQKLHPKIQTVKPILKISRSIGIDSIQMNGVAVQNWTVNADSTEIYLPAIKKGVYSFQVYGSKGNCSKEADLAKGHEIILGCNKIPVHTPPIGGILTPPLPPLPPPATIGNHMPSTTEYKVLVLTPFKPLIKVNGQSPRLDKVVRQSNGYQNFISLKSGKYNITVSDSNRQFSCPAQQVKVTKDMEVKFNCSVPVEFVPLKINVTGRNVTEAWQTTKIHVNDTLLSEDKFRMELTTRIGQGRRRLLVPSLEITIDKMPVNKSSRISIQRAGYNTKCETSVYPSVPTDNNIQGLTVECNFEPFNEIK
jgi:hypothetical protein